MSTTEARTRNRPPEGERKAESRANDATRSHSTHSRARQSTIAVLGAERMRLDTGELLELPRSIELMAEASELHGIGQFWVHADALENLGLPRGIRVSGPGEVVSHPFFARASSLTSSRAGLAAWSYWYTPGGSGFDLHIPAYSGDSPFSGVSTPGGLGAAVVAWSRASGGVRWAGAGSITSDLFLRARLRAVLAPTAAPPPVEHYLAQETAYLWHRAPGEHERGFKYCHGLDLNLAYAAAASSLELPLGPVEHAPFPFTGFDKRVPGVYLFEPPRWSSPGPAPWVELEEDGSTAVWVTGPTAERMVGMGLEPLEGWIWPQHGRWLRPWYEMLRGAREELLEGPPAALAAVKQTCRQGLGRLSSERRTLPRGAEYLEDDPTFQPYWNWAVIAEVRCRLWQRVAQLRERALVVPVAIDTDALYFLSSRRTPEALADGVGLPYGEGLGQFKAHGSCKASAAREVLELPDTGRAVAALRELVK